MTRKKRKKERKKKKRTLHQGKDRRKKKQDDGKDRKRRNFNPFTGNRPLLKILIPNDSAGVLIGKRGANITEVQDKYGGRLVFSNNGDYYPDSECERVAVIAGKVSQIIDIINHILDKVEKSRLANPRPVDVAWRRGQQVKIVLTNTCVGVVMGRAGASIKAMQKESAAKMSISTNQAPVHGERILTVFGGLEERKECCRLVIEKIAEDPTNMANSQANYEAGGGNFASGGGGGDNYGGGARGGGYLTKASGAVVGGPPLKRFMESNSRQQNMDFRSSPSPSISSNNGFPVLPSYIAPILPTPSVKPVKFKSEVEIKMHIPDILVGTLLRKQAPTIYDLVKFSGAEIWFSKRDEFAPGTSDRILSIKGDFTQTQTAYFLLHQKAEEAQIEMANHQSSSHASHHNNQHAF